MTDETTESLTTAQIEALRTAGREIAEGWQQWPDLTPEADYDFGQEGDWQHVRKVAIEAGIAWDANAAQPDEHATAIWDAVKAGYLEQIGA